MGLYTKIANHLPRIQLVKFLKTPMNSSNIKNAFSLIWIGLYLLSGLVYLVQAVTSEVSQFFPLLVKQK